MYTFKAGWFVIYTKPQHEKKVCATLLKEKIVSYLPTTKKLRTWCDRKKYIESPLFPSYVFVHLTNVQSYLQSLHIDGILYYLRFGKKIATISETVIENIKKITRYGCEVEISQEVFHKGMTLLIQDGPFTGMNCEVVQYQGKDKIIVRIDLLNRNILLNLSADTVLNTPLALMHSV
jgi:transcriptional antiterminator RfaH